MTDLETIDVIEPEQTEFIIDTSGKYMKSRLYIDSQWRQKIPTDDGIHVGHLAANGCDEVSVGTSSNGNRKTPVKEY